MTIARIEQVINDWTGSTSGTRDNYARLLSKTKANIRNILQGKTDRDYVKFFEDFLGPTLTTKLAVIAGSDSPAAGAINVAQQGTLRLTTGDSNASLAADGVQVSGSLNWKASNGDLIAEAKVSISAITAVQFFFGFTDQTSALEMPVTLSATTYATVATDAVGFMFDTTATTDTIRLVGVANDVDATHQDTSNAWAAATDTLFRVEVSTTGVATFYINDVQVGTAMTGAVTPTVALAPVIAARSLAANSKTLDIDTLLVSMLRV
jgi:hypothetical protein